ncbi:MAG: TolB family protein [Solirubrobacterales bacterium]
MAASLTGSAEASKIVYSCAPDLCAVDPESGVSAPITSDGASSAYQYPSLSRDGNRLAAARASDLVTGTYGANLTEAWGGTRDMNDVAISPDGAAVGESHSFVENRYGCPLTGGCLELVDRSETYFQIGPDPGAPFESFPGGGGVGFLGDASVLSSFYTLSTDTYTICVVADPAAADPSCEPRIVSPLTLFAPAGSPDGTLIAVSVADASDRSAVNLYEAATGASVRQLADAGSEPAFSPDGKEVAYAGAGGWIYVVPTGGGPARRLVQGLSPTWGVGFGPGPALTSTKARYRNGRIGVKLLCGGTTTCRGTLRIKKGKVTLGTRSFRLKAGAKATVSVKPTRAGQRRLEQSLPYRVTLQLKPERGRRVTKTLPLRR